MKLVKDFIFLLLCLGLFLGCRKAAVTADDQPIAYLEVSPASTSMLVQEQTQFSAKAVGKDASETALTTEATWWTSDKTVAEFSLVKNGLLQAKAPGKVVAYASYQGVTRSLPLTVYGVTGLSVSTDRSSYYIDQDATLTAVAVLSNDATQDVSNLASWSSSDTTVASVSDSEGNKGRLSPLAQGSAVITADLFGLRATLTSTVTQAGLLSLTLEPVSTLWIEKIPERVRAIGVYAGNQVRDLSDQVDWSATGGALSYTPKGNAYFTPAAAGAISLSASIGGLSASLTGTAVAGTLQEVEVWPQAPQWVVGSQENLRAWAVVSVGSVYYAKEVTEQSTWTSSAPTVVSMGSMNPSLTQAKATGSSTLSASFTQALTVPVTLSGST